MEWKIINGYSDYAISSCGKVKSLRSDKILKNSENNYGYQYVNLVKNKRKKTTAVHRLVIEHFGTEKPFENAVVDHKDNNRKNNAITNLEWVSIQENTLRSYGNLDKKLLVKEMRANGITVKQISESIGMSLSFVYDTIHS